MTALHYAADNGHEAVVAQLLQAKAEIQARDSNGRTALHWAAFNGKEAVVETLLRAKADPNAVDNNGMTAAQDAEQCCHTAFANRLRQAQGSQ